MCRYASSQRYAQLCKDNGGFEKLGGMQGINHASNSAYGDLDLRKGRVVYGFADLVYIMRV